MIESFHIADLIVKKARAKITPGEQKELDLWIKADPGNQALYDRATDPGKQLDKLEIYGLFNKEKVRANLEDELFGTRTVQFTARKILPYAATILLPLLVAGGIAYMFLNRPPGDTLAEIDTHIMPGSQKAVLVLSGGEAIQLGEEAAAETIFDGEASITDENNGLSYTSTRRRDRSLAMAYNELRTPRGGGYMLLLSDGTRVWMNAGSSLRYPVSFRDSIRRVELAGEAYFEVSHDGKPFIVSTGSMNTRVLGTSFNISAYADEATIKTTLVEGKVRVELMGDGSGISASALLEPDEQASYERSSAELTKETVDASGYVSWMQGKMEFHNEDLEIVMLRLSRWYDFEYSFENAEAKGFHFSARLDKEESISTILEMLEMTTDVKFAYKENRIVVQ